MPCVLSSCPTTPEVLSMLLFSSVSLSMRCPCMRALTTSKGKLTNQASAPLIPPATGTATLAGNVCTNKAFVCSYIPKYVPRNSASRAVFTPCPVQSALTPLSLIIVRVPCIAPEYRLAVTLSSCN
eukprot:73357-Prorocentrum_minimum.AAC.3